MIGIGLIYPVVRIHRIYIEERHIVSTTKVVRENVRDQDEEAASNGVTIAPSSMVVDKETDAEKVVVVTKDMKWVFMLIPTVCFCMALECIILAMGVQVCMSIFVMYVYTHIQCYEL